MKPLFTPDQFEQEMKALETKFKGDPENLHIEMDFLIAELLRSLGYGKGINTFYNNEIWYS